MPIRIDGAPLVIAQQKTKVVKLLGTPVGVKDDLVIDMQKQGIADIRYMMKAITLHDTQIEVNNANPPNVVLVDGREGVQLKYAKRRTEVFFGNTLDKLLIKTVQRTLAESIRANAAIPADTSLANMSGWQWMYAKSASEPATKVNVNKLNNMARGSFLVLKPTSNKVGLADMFSARKDAGRPKREWNAAAHAAAVRNAGKKFTGPNKRSGGKGFMAKAIDKLKRTRLMKNYTIHVVFTQKYKLSNELYSHGTPVIVLRAKRNKRYKRIK